MNNKIIIAIVSFVLAIMSGFGEYTYIQNLNKAQYVVPVAIQEIKPNESIKGKISYIKTNISASNVKITENENARVLIPQGSIITEEMVTSEKASQNLNEVAVKSDLINAVGGQIRAGNFVDIGFIPQKDYADQYSADVILHHVQVAGVFNQEGSEMSSKVFGNMQTSSSIAGVTLFLSEQDILKLKNYEAHGTIYFILDSNQNM